ncbi:MAG TPA: hypothetical protein VKY24_00760 [Reyranella sp.]|nr:hypothetical protein [Reyranella sp.]
MIYGALACLFLGAVFGALWLVTHIGPGWPSSMHDPKPGDRRILLGISLVLLLVAAFLVVADLIQP